VIEGQENLKIFIAKYYKDLFGSSQRNTFSLDESEIDDIPQINEEENKLLTETFTEKEEKLSFKWPCSMSSTPETCLYSTSTLEQSP
jgi:hypothetical protein